MIKAVIFDFGGVVVSAGFENWIREYLPNEEKIHDKIMQVGPQVDRGTLSARAYTNLFSKITGKTSEEINAEILLLYEVQKDVLNIIKKLHGKVKIGLIANFPSEWFDFLFEKFFLKSYFDSVIVSGSIHIIKPEAEVYKKILEDIHVKAENSVFIDDNLPNVLGAKDIGMRGIHFTDAPSLIHDLKQLGIQL